MVRVVMDDACNDVMEIATIIVASQSVTDVHTCNTG